LSVSILRSKTGRITRKLERVQFRITLHVLKVYVLEEKSIDGLMQTRFYEAKNMPENRYCLTFLV